MPKCHIVGNHMSRLKYASSPSLDSVRFHSVFHTRVALNGRYNSLSAEFLKWTLPVDEQDKLTIDINEQVAAKTCRKSQARPHELDFIFILLSLDLIQF